MTSLRAEFLTGIKAELPVAVGVLPFGMIYGVLALNAGLSPWQAQAMSSIVFAGSAQFIGIQLIGVGTPMLILWLTTFIINLRHTLYSVSLAPKLVHLAVWWRWLLAYLLTDEAYIVSILHYEDQRQPLRYKHWYMLGAGLTLWVTWQLSAALGIFLGAQIPTSWSLDFTMALTFIGMVVPVLKDRPSIAAALTAGIIAVATAHWPYKLNLILAAIGGIVVGLTTEERFVIKLNREEQRI